MSDIYSGGYSGRAAGKAEETVLRYLARTLECLMISRKAVQHQCASLSDENAEKLSLQIKHSAEIVHEASLYHRSASAMTADIRKTCADDSVCADFLRQVDEFEERIAQVNSCYLDSIDNLVKELKNQMGKYSIRLAGMAKTSKITRTGGEISFIQSSEMIDISV